MVKRLGLRLRLNLMILPLVLVVVVISGILSSLESRTALTRVANRHMAFKAEQLRDYAYSEWEAIRKLQLENESEFRRALEESFRNYTASLLRSRTESIMAFNAQGELVLQVGVQEESSDAILIEPVKLSSDLQPGWFSDNLLGEPRVGVVFELEPFDWMVAVTELQSSFFSDIQNIHKMHIWILAAAVTVLTVLISIFIGHIVGPVERLTEKIMDITSTMDLSRQAEIEFADEIGLLAQKFNTMITTLQRNYEELRETSDHEKEARRTAIEREGETLVLLGRVSDFRDEDTGKHLQRIGDLSELLSQLFGLNEEQQDLIRYSSPLHDIGKIGIPDSILLKPGRLTEDEFTQIKQHTVIGHRLLNDTESKYLIQGASIAITHHEKWDGSGYPNGLAGEDIPVFGRIVAIVDVFDALTSKRPYKEAWSFEKALDLIREQRGRHFDPQLVDLFDKHFNEFIDLL